MLRLSPLNSQLMIAVFLETPWLISLETTGLIVLTLKLAGLMMGTFESSLSVQLQAPIWNRQLIGFLDLFHIFDHNILFGVLYTFTSPLCIKPYFHHFTGGEGWGACKKDNV